LARALAGRLAGPPAAALTLDVLLAFWQQWHTGSDAGRRVAHRLRGLFRNSPGTPYTSAPEKFRLRRAPGVVALGKPSLLWTGTELFPSVDKLPGDRWVGLDGKKLMELPLGGNNDRFSPSGGWTLADGEAFHIGTGRLEPLDKAATASVFTPTGDVITGRSDGTLAKYCLHTDLLR